MFQGEHLALWIDVNSLQSHQGIGIHPSKPSSGLRIQLVVTMSCLLNVIISIVGALNLLSFIFLSSKMFEYCPITDNIYYSPNTGYCQDKNYILLLYIK